MIQDLYKAKKVLGVEVGTGASGSNNRYTLEMVRIDDKVKEVITKIKLEEAAIAHRQNTVEGSSSTSFCSYLIQKLHR